MESVGIRSTRNPVAAETNMRHKLGKGVFGNGIPLWQKVCCWLMSANSLMDYFFCRSGRSHPKEDGGCSQFVSHFKGNVSPIFVEC